MKFISANVRADFKNKSKCENNDDEKMKKTDNI